MYLGVSADIISSYANTYRPLTPTYLCATVRRCRYMLGLTLDYLQEQGGVDAMHGRTSQRAHDLYAVADRAGGSPDAPDARIAAHVDGSTC